MGLLRFVFFITIVSVSCKPVDIRNVRTEELTAIVLEENEKVVNITEEIAKNDTDLDLTRIVRNQIRPGMSVDEYSVEINPNINEGTFSGRAEIEVSINDANTREDPIRFYIADLDVSSVRFSLLGGTEHEARFEFNDDDGTLDIETDRIATGYTFVIEYTGFMQVPGRGLYVGHYDDNTYLAMNLHPTYARRVFPCMDEPTQASMIDFTFKNLEYTHVMANSMLVENNADQFHAIEVPPHLWGMVAHNFINTNIPTSNVLLFGRPGVNSQDQLASAAINAYFNNLNEWTGKPYLEINLNQDGRMNIIGLPDVSRDWTALSTVGIWEPYLFMETVHSMKQRKTALVKIAEAMSRQWYGYVIFPENWRFEWVVSGLATYAGYEMVKMFQSDSSTDSTQLDVNTLFVTDVIQESLLRDSYQNARVLEPSEDIFDEGEIRDHINGLVKYKAPAIMRMMRLVLGDANNDFIHIAARALLNRRSLQTVNSLLFIDALNSQWPGNSFVGDIDEYLEPWIMNNGYPLLRVDLRQGLGVFVSQERFGFTNTPHVAFDLPITYTTSIDLNFDDSRIYPVDMLTETTNIPMLLEEEDWVLFNIQGQGYYRVNYDDQLWERIIEALEDPERRDQIHPLNRATLVDDALNVARAGILNYDTAFRVVLTMEHETEYAVWKAFVRNMNFLRKRLVALVTEDEDLDPDIYLRMVRRTIHAFENEIGFTPDINVIEPAMTSLTRGLVMDHACRSGYQPCIAAAVDWFYDPNNNEVVNPNIPHEIRPAVYCTMVREGDEDVIEALRARLEIEISHYERVVILESLACSQDEDYIRSLLQETISADSGYGIEERVKIFTAVAESSYGNAAIANNFLAQRVIEVRNMYGGPEKLEEVIYNLAENVVDIDNIYRDFDQWVNSQLNNLDDSQDAATRALAQVNEDQNWNRVHMQNVYEWIDENHAPTLMLSMMALCVSLMVALLNH